MCDIRGEAPGAMLTALRELACDNLRIAYCGEFVAGASLVTPTPSRGTCHLP